jgi:dihydroneopterin aldolase/2-amino-4-hydroxy-6-hydroxymethyldihydropteridine diphosphokinase
MARAFIGVGSNIAPEKNIREALRLLARLVRIVAISTFYRTPAIDRPSDPDFYNGVVAIETDLRPMALKSKVLRKIEAALGRRRSADKYASRTIDLDLLVLTPPDPDILNRAFVAVPLAEIEPDLLLPGVDHLSKEGMQPLVEFTQKLRAEHITPCRLRRLSPFKRGRL